MIIAQFYRHIFSAEVRAEMCGTGEERQKEKYCKENFYLLPLCLPPPA